MKTKTSSYRLEYLDWVRGIGALIMLQGHVFDSFLKNDLRGGAPYMLSQFAGGMPPAIFLFLTGVTLAFLMDSTERKGLLPLQRLSTAFRRSGYLFLLAFAFRIQLWIFSQPAPWIDLFRVDILNCMGFAIAVLSLMALFRTVERVRLCAVVGLAIAFGAPLVSQMDWSAAPEIVRNYLVPDYRFFSFFPWAAYLAFGMSAGSIIRIAPQDAMERAMQWAAIIGRRPDPHLPVLRQPAVFDLCEIRLLAEQPRPDTLQAGSNSPPAGVGVPLDALCRQGRLELGSPIRHDVPAGLLGAHRAGLRPLALVLEERSDSGPDRHGSGVSDPADARALRRQDQSVSPQVDALRMGLVVQSQARRRRRRLTRRAILCVCKSPPLRSRL